MDHERVIPLFLETSKLAPGPDGLVFELSGPAADRVPEGLPGDQFLSQVGQTSGVLSLESFLAQTSPGALQEMTLEWVQNDLENGTRWSASLP